MYQKVHEWLCKNTWLYLATAAIIFTLGCVIKIGFLIFLGLIMAIGFIGDKFYYKWLMQQNHFATQAEFASMELESKFIKNTFVEPMIVPGWQQKYATLVAEAKTWPVQTARAKNARDKLLQWDAYAKQRVHKWNEQVAASHAPQVKAIVPTVKGKPLDTQQLSCIAKDVHNSLVIAGAGTGKTTTVIGKIKYLLNTGKYKPEDFLVLSYTNASAADMSTRITKETGTNINASTFHKLGLNIITTTNGIKPKIIDIDMRRFISEAIKENMANPTYAELMKSYIFFHHLDDESTWKFETEQEYQTYLRFNPPCTMQQETVKSYGEVDIANFLYINQIKYVYEKPYPIDTRTTQYGEYKPDFYLPEYDVYIEYFGIDANGNVPAYFTGKNGLSAKEAYNESIRWKRQLHAQNNTRLIECFAWEQFSGTLIEELQRKLNEAGVQCNPQNVDVLWDQISKDNESVIDSILQLFETIINLMKSNRYTIEDVRCLATKHKRRRDINIVLKLIEPIAQKYDETLKARGAIDFNDMINQATDCITSGRYQNTYKYVIVDEYQDISHARFMLLKALRNSQFYDLFCVGDDWQSIYRFAGSDISFILDFEKYWGPAETSKIETTYRFSQELSEISGQFVMKNPAQVRKTIVGFKSEESPVVSEIYGTNLSTLKQNLYSSLQSLPHGSEVYFIGRYRSDIKIFDEESAIDYHYDNADGKIKVVFKRRPDLIIHFVTVHQSKGLQADYVFIINNKSSRMGFPSKIQDAPILELLLGSIDKYPFAEERRLYYVALTRARRKVFLCTLRHQESMFVFDALSLPLCPLCGGRMFKRTGKWGSFLGCENYSANKCTYTRKIVSE